MNATLPLVLARVHRAARANPWLRRFTLANRLLLAMAFLPTGLVKVTGQRFTLLPVDNPIGFFFEAMYRTGPYWYFIGAAQVLAAVLLLIPRTAALGALVFLPVGTSVFLITWGIGFGNTTIVTGAMLLAGIYLVCWDGDRVWAAAATILRREGAADRVMAGMNRLELAGWTLGGVCGMGIFLNTRGFVPGATVVWLFAGGAAAAVMVTAGMVLREVPKRRAPRAIQDGIDRG